MKHIQESKIEEIHVPGRFLRWMVGKDCEIKSEFCSCCVMRVEPGSTVNPAHSHPDGEELIYVIKGSGEVFVDGKICSVHEGSAVLFERSSVHMVRNNGLEEMKVICFFAPPSCLAEYKFHLGVEFEEYIDEE